MGQSRANVDRNSQYYKTRVVIKFYIPYKTITPN